MMRGHRGLSRPTEKPEKVWPTFRRLLDYLRPHWKILLLAGAMVLIDTLTQLAAPYLIGQAVDRFIIQGDLTGLTRIMLLLLGVYVAGWLGRAVQFMSTVRMGQQILYRMRGQLFRHFQALSLRFFDGREAGDLMARITSDTDAIN
ncbi:MAG: ABC transporter transmembrane domain-containing protein, partial [Anaerolineae bacterium]